MAPAVVVNFELQIGNSGIVVAGLAVTKVWLAVHESSNHRTPFAFPALLIEQRNPFAQLCRRWNFSGFVPDAHTGNLQFYRMHRNDTAYSCTFAARPPSPLH